LDVSVPIRISVAVKKSFWTSTVGVKGCEEKTFKVKARFDPGITSSDGLRFSIGDVSVEPTDYQCGLHWVVELKDVAAIILVPLSPNPLIPVGVPNPLLHNPLNSVANTSTTFEPPSQEEVRPEALPGMVALRILRS
jgi:hypothetical protein